MPRAATRPTWWPRFRSPLRSTAVTARIGRVLGIAIGICFLTGLLSHYQYEPWSWLPLAAAPVWGYRLTQGVHVATGTATIPLLLLKLWSVYPNLFRWPPVSTIRKAVERLSVFLLVASALVQVSTGFVNTLDWYPFGWFFTPVHHWLGWVLVGSVLLHIAVKLPDIVYGLRTPVADGEVLSEQAPEEAAVLPSDTTGISRRGVLTAAGAGIGLMVVTTVGQTVTPLEPVGLLAVRQGRRGPQGVPVNRTAEQAKVVDLAMAPDWALTVEGPQPYALGLAEVEALAAEVARLPITCVEGWSVDASWQGLSLLDLVLRAGGTADSHVTFRSLEPEGYNRTEMFGPQLGEALLATHLNGERLSIDHGYPLRLIAPNRAGVLNTKWLTAIEVR